MQSSIKEINMAGRKEHLLANKRKRCCPVKQYKGERPAKVQNVPRPLMFSRLIQEVKRDFSKRLGNATTHQLQSRKVRRIRMLDLARATMQMIREKGSHKAA
jgi:hypothetical protein